LTNVLVCYNTATYVVRQDADNEEQTILDATCGAARL
jgi:hypothetical protein